MSFIQNGTGLGYAPGWFLAEADCSRQTRTIPQNHAQVKTTAEGGKYVPMGAVFPSNDANAIGIVYEDVDVTTGAMPGSVVTAGVIYADRLPTALASAAKTALEGKGFTIITAVPTVTRPSDTSIGSMTALTVASAAGTAAGDTAVTVTGYTLGSGEKWAYKVASDNAPTIGYNVIADFTWTEWDGTSDITAATGKKIAVIAVDADGRAKAYGSATVTAMS